MKSDGITESHAEKGSGSCSGIRNLQKNRKHASYRGQERNWAAEVENIEVASKREAETQEKRVHDSCLALMVGCSLDASMLMKAY